jgi:hypothetical protein
MNRAALLLSIGLLGFASGCASGPVQTYEGPARPLDRVARLDAVDRPRTRLHGFDDRRVKAGTILIEPGPHDVWAYTLVQHQVDMAYWTISNYCLLRVVFEPGHHYELRDAFERIKGDAHGDQVVIGATIVEPATQKIWMPVACGAKPDLAR